MQKTYSNPDVVAPPAARYSHAVRVELGDGALIYVCGQLPIDAEGNLVGDGDVAGQAEQVFENMEAVLEANGTSMRDVVKTNTYVTDISRIAEVNEVRARHFSSDAAPTSTTMEVGGLARPGWMVEIEAVAAT